MYGTQELRLYPVPQRGVVEDEVTPQHIGHVKFAGTSWEAILYMPKASKKQLSSDIHSILKPGTTVTIWGNVSSVLLVTYREIDFINL